METRTAPFNPEPRCPAPAPAAWLVCPLCGGRLQPLGDQRRCTRCAFSLCDGCEGGPDETASGSPG